MSKVRAHGLRRQPVQPRPLHPTSARQPKPRQPHPQQPDPLRFSRLKAGVLSVCVLTLSALCSACGQGGEDGAPDLPPFGNLDSASGRLRGPKPSFSFFVTSQTGLLSLPAGKWSPAPDPVDGFGGDFGGLEGADEICSMLAQRSNPGDTKLWHAFLSTSGIVSGTRVDAIDRIGDGPWYDFRGFKLASNRAGLMPRDDREGRPSGADPQLAAMFTGENGEEMRVATGIDNHDTLTGSERTGRLYDDQEQGRIATCEDWTSRSVRGMPGNQMATGGQVPVGHSWPRSNNEGRHWISEHTVNGCERGGRTNGGTAAPQGDFRVGGAGGYGGFYCFALNAVAPRDSELPH